jgi:aldehyde:ferredoxin oxidoreductase
MDRYGYWNRILHVDLTERRSWVEEPGDELYRLLLGGRGFIARTLLRETPAGMDAYDPRNPLMFMPGVLTGVPIPGAGRHTVGARSPLSMGYGESESGGFWGAELKKAGWDGIVVHGASEVPVYLWINEEQVEFRDASHLWGMVTGDVEERLVAELGDPRIKVAQIGPAGEHLVRYASIGNDLNEVAGRAGMGAVMGSKQLKAIAVRGKKNVPVADPEVIKRIAKWVAATLDEKHYAFHNFGTGASMVAKNAEGGMPTLNYALGQFAGVEQITAQAVREQVRIEMHSCYACSVRCKKVVRVEARATGETLKNGRPVPVDPKGRYDIDPRYGGPEYESLASLGANLGVDDLIAVCKANERCNALCLDTISTGCTIAWAAECFERGLLTTEDTGGYVVRFRDPDQVVDLVEKIARREGAIGDLLADGAYRAARRIGRGTERYVVHVKGLEIAMHDPRHMADVRTSYLFSPTGGDHMRSATPKNGLRNSAGLCFFLNYDEPTVLDALRGVTGWDLTQEELDTIFERGVTLARLVNMREGVTRADDTLPPRMREDLPKHAGINSEQIDVEVTEYYRDRGWDPDTGVPTPARLAELGLGDVLHAAV